MKELAIVELKAQYASLRDEINAAVERVLTSQHFILGPEVGALEREIASYARVKHAMGVSSGTDALLVALMALGIGAGDEVITTPFTFIATGSVIARLGATPVFVDIDAASFNLDAAQVEAKVGPSTRAIVPVHLFGQMADMRALQELSGRLGVPILEDAAQALGSEFEGNAAGTSGSIGTYSFFPTKNLGGIGDGGMIVTNDDRLAERVRLLRNQGQKPKYNSIIVGGNFRLDEIQAAVLRAKLPHLDRWNAGRRANAMHYRELFAASKLNASSGILGDACIALPSELPNRTHVYHHFVLRVRDRDALRTHLQANGIGTEVYYPHPMHLQPCFEGLGYGAGALPEAERAAREVMAIPVYPELSADDLARIVDAIAAFYAV